MLESQYFYQIVFKVIDWGTCWEKKRSSLRPRKTEPRSANDGGSTGELIADWRSIASTPSKPTCCHGSSWDPRDLGGSGAEGSGAGLRDPSRRGAAQLRHLGCPAAGLLSWRVAAQAGQTGACELIFTWQILDMILKQACRWRKKGDHWSNGPAGFLVCLCICYCYFRKDDANSSDNCAGLADSLTGNMLC